MGFQLVYIGNLCRSKTPGHPSNCMMSPPPPPQKKKWMNIFSCIAPSHNPMGATCCSFFFRDHEGIKIDNQWVIKRNHSVDLFYLLLATQLPEYWKTYSGLCLTFKWGHITIWSNLKFKQSPEYVGRKTFLRGHGAKHIKNQASELKWVISKVCQHVDVLLKAI